MGVIMRLVSSPIRKPHASHKSYLAYTKVDGPDRDSCTISGCGKDCPLGGLLHTGNKFPVESQTACSLFYNGCADTNLTAALNLITKPIQWCMHFNNSLRSKYGRPRSEYSGACSMMDQRSKQHCLHRFDTRDLRGNDTSLVRHIVSRANQTDF